MLKLGLLFGQEDNVVAGHLPEALSFQHKLIQDYFAALFLAKKAQEDESFLTSAFKNVYDMFIDNEVLKFTCGRLDPQDAYSVTNCIAKIVADQALEDLNMGGSIRKHFIKRLQSYHDQSSHLAISPHLCIYPSCGCPLSYALKFSKLVIIDGLNEKDPLTLEAPTASIIISLPNEKSLKDGGKEVSRLMKALSSAHANLIGIEGVFCEEGFKLHNFSQLQSICNIYHWPRFGALQEKNVRDVTDSIRAWGQEPRLRILTCELPFFLDKFQAISVYIPFIKALSKCIHLRILNLFGGNPNECIPALMGVPPPDLRQLSLEGRVTVHRFDSVLDSITKAVRQNKLQKLEVIEISAGYTSDAAMVSLVKAFIDVRPDKQLHIVVDDIPAELESLCKSTKITLEDSVTNVSKLAAQEEIAATFL